MPVETAQDLDADFLRATARPKITAKSPRTLGIVDLFSGCGGLTIGAVEGARRKGVQAELRLAVDQWRGALDVLQCTLDLEDDRVLETSVASIFGVAGQETDTSARATLKAVAAETDLLLAGPPCQGHSALNNHTRHDDDRNELYVAMADAAELLQPKVVIVENVRGIARDKRGALATCRARLEEHYKVSDAVLDLHELGVPQHRSRHVLVATKDEAFDLDELPLKPGRDVRWAIGDLDQLDAKRLLDTASVPSAENEARMAWLMDHPNEFDLPNGERPSCHQSDHSYRSMYGQLRWDEPAQTITSGFGSMGQGRFVHPAAARTLTPHEAARLQCLPDWMDFRTIDHRTALATMIGNAAPPILSMSIVEQLIESEQL